MKMQVLNHVVDAYNTSLISALKRGFFGIKPLTQTNL